MVQIPRRLLDEMLLLATYAVSQHVHKPPKDGTNPKSDHGWSRAYPLMKSLQQAQEFCDVQAPSR